jgi:hypothetical protein
MPHKTLEVTSATGQRSERQLRQKDNQGLKVDGAGKKGPERDGGGEMQVI